MLCTDQLKMRPEAHKNLTLYFPYEHWFSIHLLFAAILQNVTTTNNKNPLHLKSRAFAVIL